MNAVELTAHLSPAPDHAPVQGRVFMNTEFAKMQSGSDFEGIDGRKYIGFERKIGEWNCMYMAMGFDTRYSVRKYTDEQLKKILEDNEKGCTVNGKHYTMYQANQQMRRIETEVRRQKDVAAAAKEAGNEPLQGKAQEKINWLGKQYLEFSKQSGLKPKWNRMNVEGFSKYQKQAEPNAPYMQNTPIRDPDSPVEKAIESGEISTAYNRGDYFKHVEGDPNFITPIKLIV